MLSYDKSHKCCYAMLSYDKSHKQLFCCARLRLKS